MPSPRANFQLTTQWVLSCLMQEGKKHAIDMPRKSEDLDRTEILHGDGPISLHSYSEHLN